MISGIVVRYSSKSGSEPRKVKKRFRITNEEMKALRADYDARRRQHEKAIKAATTLDELEVASEAAKAEGAAAYRHFDLEILNAAVKAKRESITEKMSADEAEEHAIKEREKHLDNLVKWTSGEDVRLYFSGDNRLRINGQFVECSNGNKVSCEAARKTLGFVRRHREKGWESNGEVHDVDVFRLKRIDRSGVQMAAGVCPMKIRELLTDASKWTQRRPAVDATQNDVPVNSHRAASWCLYGAAMKCYPGDGLTSEVDAAIWQRIVTAVPGKKPITWNDTPGRTFAEVRELVERLDI